MIKGGKDLSARSQHLLLLVLTGLLAGALISGCGDSGADDDGSTIPTSSISKSEFVDQANAICQPQKTRLLSEVIAYQKKHLNEASEKLVPDTARKIIRPAVEAQIEEIRDLGAPEGDAAEIESFFASLRSGVDAIIAKKPTTYEAAEGMLLQAARDADRYGMDQCDYQLVDKEVEQRIRNSG
jgi:hypothetical protein